MEKLEQEMRKNLIGIMWVTIIVQAVLELGFFTYYAISRTLQEHVIIYLLKRFALPLGIDLALYYFVRKYDYYDNPTDKKNALCAFSFCTIVGIAGVFHAYYTPLWCGAALVLMISTVFHDKKLQKILMVYSIILVFIAAVWAIIEHPERFVYYIGTFVVVLCIVLITYEVSNVLLEHNEGILGLNHDLQDNQVVYEEQIQYDMLTTVCSRRYLMERAKLNMKECSPNHPVSIAIIDIDNFKRVNDTYGHENGDVVLNRLGSILFPHISESVTIGRYGGEEFVFVFDKTDIHKAEALVEELRKEFEAQKYDFCENPITFSGGFVACYEPLSFEKALEVADQGLYYSKEHGKNQIKVQDRIIK